MSGEQQQDGAGGRDIADLLSGENLDAHRVSASIAAAVRELREQLADATARAEKAEAYARSLTGAVQAAADFSDAVKRIREMPAPDLGAVAAANAAFIAAAADRIAAQATDAAQDGLNATLWGAEGVQASADGNSSSITPQGLSEPEPPRDPSAWCWAPNPAGRLHCGRLRDHEPPHRRGERTWGDDDATEEGR